MTPPKKTKALTETTFYILLCLHRPTHGYALMQDIADITHDRVTLGPGTLYGALDTMQKKKWITPLEGDPQDRKIAYLITDLGRQVFATELSRLEELLRHAREMKGNTHENSDE